MRIIYILWEKCVNILRRILFSLGIFFLLFFSCRVVCACVFVYNNKWNEIWGFREFLFMVVWCLFLFNGLDVLISGTFYFFIFFVECCFYVVGNLHIWGRSYILLYLLGAILCLKILRLQKANRSSRTQIRCRTFVG